jgi:D-glycero-D-manno-heptose 1,7-bisphosphate phosphatase
MARKAIFLDRDGVINAYVYNAEFGTVDSPNSPGEFTLTPGAGEAVAELNRLGFLVVVVSNQPGIAKGKFTPSLHEQVTAKMHASLAVAGGKVDAVYYCLHHPDAVLAAYRARCECRKPLPGMLLEAARDWDIDLHNSYMIGDGITDIEAGRAAGTRTVFIGQSKPYIMEAFDKHGIQPDFMSSTLAGAVKIIQEQVASNKTDGT